jgi:hypothetical protein
MMGRITTAGASGRYGGCPRRPARIPVAFRFLGRLGRRQRVDVQRKRDRSGRFLAVFRRQIAAWAEDDFRSVNGQIEYLLTECVKKRKGSGIPSYGKSGRTPDKNSSIP